MVVHNSSSLDGKDGCAVLQQLLKMPAYRIIHVTVRDEHEGEHQIYPLAVPDMVWPQSYSARAIGVPYQYNVFRGEAPRYYRSELTKSGRVQRVVPAEQASRAVSSWSITPVDGTYDYVKRNPPLLPNINRSAYS